MEGEPAKVRQKDRDARLTVKYSKEKVKEGGLPLREERGDPRARHVQEQHPSGARMPRRPLPEHIARANAKRSAIRSAVEHVFAGQKHRIGLFIRTIGIAKARIKIGRTNLAYNIQRLA